MIFVSGRSDWLRAEKRTAHINPHSEKTAGVEAGNFSLRSGP